MAQLSDVSTTFRVHAMLLLLGCVISTGCGETHSQADVSGSPYVSVTHQGKPLPDVQVRLHEHAGGPVIAQSISRPDGNAYFTDVPSPEPTKYFVTVESLGDGGWMLDTKACEELSKSVSLEPLESVSSQRIEIPKRAVKILSSPKRR